MDNKYIYIFEPLGYSESGSVYSELLISGPRNEENLQKKTIQKRFLKLCHLNNLGATKDKCLENQ